MGDQSEANVGHHEEADGGRESSGEERKRNNKMRGRRQARRKQSAKQDFQSQPVIRCGISIVHSRTGGTEGKEDLRWRGERQG